MTGYEKVDVIPDTPEWLEERAKTIGASEVAAILGLSNYGATPLTVYKSKLGAPTAFPPLLAFIGHASEAIIEEWVTRFAKDEYPEFADEIGQLKPGFMARSKASPWLHATFDRIVQKGMNVVPWQFKTAHQFAGHHWDEGVPVDVEAQVQAEMHVAGSEYAFVVVWIGGRDFKLFRLERNLDWIDKHLIPKTRAFYYDHLLPRVAPDPVTRAEIAEVYPSEHGYVEGLPDVFAWVEQRELLIADKKRIEEELVPLELGLGTYMGVHDTLTKDGVPILTYKSQAGRRSVDFNRLWKEWPAAYGDTVTVGRDYKVFRRIKPPKE